MDIREYYYRIFDKLKKGFQFSHYVLGYGDDLRLRDIAHGRKPRSELSLPVTVEPISNLWDLTVNWGLEVFIPSVGHNSCAVLSSLDYEIFLEDAQRLYAHKDSQWHYFHNYIGPVTGFIGNKLEEYRIPYLLDLTPSGGHFLFWVRAETEEWKELVKVGYLEGDLKRAYDYFDHSDIKRNPKIKREAGYVYSGIGRIWEYLSRLAMQEVRTGVKELPLTLSNPVNKCVNLDITQYADPAFMRIMRAPFSAHKKRSKVIPEAAPLVDVILWDYNSSHKIGEMDFKDLIEKMWDFAQALEHAEQFSGYIPCANEGLVKLIEEYKHSTLYEFHQWMDNEPDLERQEAFYMAENDSRLDEKTKNVLAHPNPRVKDPKALIKFVADLQQSDWHPKHIGNLIADLYEQSEHNWNGDNWLKYPSRTRGNFWARIYSSI